MTSNLSFASLMAMILALILLNVACGSASKSSGSIGKAGSTARFAIVGNYLYTISGREKALPRHPMYENQFQYDPLIRSFDLSNPTEPRQLAESKILESPETLFTDGKQLYIGAQSGMGIYQLFETGEISQRSIVSHLRACDPVVTEGTTAYVTLHNAPTCQGTVNVLQIIDISTPNRPSVVLDFPMNAPFGLAVQSGRAYICDGPVGLRVLDVKVPSQIRELPGVGEDICIDVILQENRLITTGFTGIGQYDVSVSPPQKLSVITVGEPPA